MTEIRELSGIADLLPLEELQIDVWHCHDREVLPALHMVAAREVGAIILGAFDDGRLVGFVYGYPGFEGEHRIIHSDMLAVREEYRGRGLGVALKMAQREAALARGIDRITWTFDPLQIRNAYVNFVKLGVTADRYLPNFYGTTSSPLHRLGTDRLWVRWILKDRPRQPRTEMTIDVPREPTEKDGDRVRHAFLDAFAKGYVATGFERTEKGGRYLLTRMGSGLEI